MQGLLDSLPWLIAMLLLIGCSAFFSGSEAALFYLRRGDRRILANGTPAQRAAARLLNDPERLLSAVLFWNLVVNIAYFSIATIVGLRLERHPSIGQTGGVAFATTALLTIIFLSEMVPKSIAVLRARSIAGFVGIPLATFVGIIDPIMPWLRSFSDASRRVILPNLVEESYLELNDLEQAIDVSNDVTLMEQERTVLHNIVALSDIRVEEWMRPRRRLTTFGAPVSMSDLSGHIPPTGYLLITGDGNDDIVQSVHVPSLVDFDVNHLEHQGTDVIFIPWCSPVSDAFQEMIQKSRDVAVIVNELGETVGVLTREHIVDAVLTDRPERGERLLNRVPLRQVQQGVWEVEGVTNLRRLAREFQADLPDSRHVTVGGIVQETLERLPRKNDECRWGPFYFVVLQADADRTLLRMTIAEAPS